VNPAVHVGNKLFLTSQKTPHPQDKNHPVNAIQENKQCLLW